MANKLIITNRTALTAKYTASGLAQVEASLTTMIASDRTRNVITTLVYLDDVVQMARFKAPPVTNAASAQQNKVAIDAVVSATNPVFMMILDASDVVPFQPLNNPVPGDPDLDVPSDLPYACDAPYSLFASDFTAPTRLVGRIPGVLGASTPDNLIRAIANLISFRPTTRTPYLNYFAVCMQNKSDVTGSVLDTVFGNRTNLSTSPPNGPDWSNTQYQAKIHVFGLHGSSSDPNWFGDDGAGSQPEAVKSSLLAGKSGLGTIVGTQCCYGAQLYRPPANQPLPICNTYVVNGAIGLFGCTVIGYSRRNGGGGLGPSDLYNQLFLTQALTPQSLGSAFLKARQQYVASGGAMLTTSSLKMLAGFVFYGDPSITAITSWAAQSEADGVDGRGTAGIPASQPLLPKLVSESIVDQAMERRLLSELKALGELEILHSGTHEYEQRAGNIVEQPHRLYTILARRPGKSSLPRLVLLEAFVRTGGSVTVNISESS